MVFISSWKLFSFLRYLHFSFDIFEFVGKLLDKKATVNSKYMTSQSGTQIIAINILPGISKSKCNQIMKLGRSREYNVINNFLQNHEENEAGRLAVDLFPSCKKALYKVKASGYHLSFNKFCSSKTWTYNENKLYETSDCWSRDILKFFFLKKGSETSFFTIFCA